MDLGQTFKDVKSWVSDKIAGDDNSNDSNIWSALKGNMNMFTMAGALLSALIMFKMPGDIKMKMAVATAVMGASVMLSSKLGGDFQRSADPNGQQYAMAGPQQELEGPHLEQ